MEKTVILGCSALEPYIRAAQEREGTAYPVVLADRELHSEPRLMRARLMELIGTLEADTVLVAMGFCGGSFEAFPCPCRMVLPYADDCVTLLLHRDDTPACNLKEPGHLYLINDRAADVCPESILKKLTEDYGEESAKIVLDSWFESYVSLDVVDTGFYDCRSAEYADYVRRNAELMHCPFAYVTGSNYLLEKLVAGHWDGQFKIYEKGEVITSMNFLPEDALYFQYSPV